MSKAEFEFALCPHHIGISNAECNVPDDCPTCGWYPAEEKRRKALLRWREEAHHLQNGPLIIKRRTT